MNRAWIAVASADHVRRGRADGFMQVCHGKRGPLARLRPGDGVAYYSPTAAFRAGAALRAFTAVGIVAEGEPYEAAMEGASFWRRDVVWREGRDVPAAALVPRLAAFAGRPNWGAPLRFGLLAVPPEDWRAIADAAAFEPLMGAHGVG